MGRIHFDLVKSGESARNDPLPLPCDYFDLIGGTSTGGYVIPTLLRQYAYLIMPINSLIALMIGRLRMSVDDATRVYAALSDKVFSKKNMKTLKNELFKATTLEKAFKDIITKQIAELSKKEVTTEQVEKDQQSQDQLEKAADALIRMMDSQADNVSCKTCGLPITSYPIATHVS